MNLVSKNELEQRLLNWANEYGGSKYENIGFQKRNILQTLIEHGGFIPDPGGFKRPPIRTAADEVDQAVLSMERDGMFKQGRVVRCEYFMLDSPEESKLQALRRIGLPMSRAGYYNYLAQAKAFIAGFLKHKAA